MGPSSMLFGRGSTGGVINQVTKKPALKQGDRAQRPGDDQRPHPHHRRRQHAVRRDQRGARQRHVPVRQGLDDRPDQRAGLRHGAVGQVRHRHADRDHAAAPSCSTSKDKVDYGVPPLNGFPINVPRNVNYGLSDDYTEQDVIQLNATVDHKFNDDLRCATRREFTWVNTVGPPDLGRLRRHPGSGRSASSRQPTGPVNTPYSGAPLNQLYVRQLSRDRNINDITLENQTELEAKFETGPIGHLLLMGFELDYEQLHQQDDTRTGFCNNVPAGGTARSAARRPASPLAAARRATCRRFPATTPSSQAWGARRLLQRHDPGHAVAEAGRRPALGRLLGADRQLDQLGQHGRQHRDALPVQQTDYFTSVRAGAIFEPTTGAVLLRLVQHLVQSVARAAHLDDRHAAAAAGEQRRLRGRRQVRASSTATCR